jgi:hypothetical protein
MSGIITNADLHRYSLAQLQAMYGKVHQELVKSAKGSADRRNALASLENIRRAIRLRRMQATPRP